MSGHFLVMAALMNVQCSMNAQSVNVQSSLLSLSLFTFSLSLSLDKWMNAMNGVEV